MDLWDGHSCPSQLGLILIDHEVGESVRSVFLRELLRSKAFVAEFAENKSQSAQRGALGQRIRVPTSDSEGIRSFS